MPTQSKLVTQLDAEQVDLGLNFFGTPIQNNFQMRVLTNLSKGGHKDPERDDEGDLNALEVDVEDLVLVLGVPLVYRLVVPKARVADMVLGEGEN